MKSVVLFFEWKYKAFLARERNYDYPIVYEGRASQRIDYNEKVAITEQLPAIRNILKSQIVKRYRPQADERAEEMGDKVEQDSVKLFNVREENLWSGLEEF